jgi:hypothetical protein
VKPRTPRIQAGWNARRARIWLKEIPRKVYQRKKALMSRPGMVFNRLRLLLVVVVALMRTPGPLKRDGSWLRSDEVGPKDDEACSFDCIFSIFV